MIRGAAALLTLGALSGCGGGIAPGEYVIYRVAFAKSIDDAGCYTDGKIPPDDANDVSNIRESATLIVYAGVNDDLYLDLGKATLRGKAVETGYAFTGRYIDVSYVDTNNGRAELTETQRIDIEMMLDGRAVKGTSVSTASLDCAGPGCLGPLPDPCTSKTTFVGTQVDDVQLQHAL